VQESEENDQDDTHDTDPKKRRLFLATTLHQASVVRWLSLSDLLESIRNAFPSLIIVLNSIGESRRLQSINMDIIDKVIDFLCPWKFVLNELQRTDTPSLFLVLPCITYLRDELSNGVKRDKTGKQCACRCWSLRRDNVDEI
jgi:hypothetical protein